MKRWRVTSQGAVRIESGLLIRRGLGCRVWTFDVHPKRAEVIATSAGRGTVEVMLASPDTSGEDDDAATVLVLRPGVFRSDAWAVVADVARSTLVVAAWRWPRRAK